MKNSILIHPRALTALYVLLLYRKFNFLQHTVSFPSPTTAISILNWVRAGSPDDSAVNASATRPLTLQADGGWAARGIYATRVTAERLGGAGRTARDSAGGIGGSRAPAAQGQCAATAYRAHSDERVSSLKYKGG